jgi:hypothetical protein
MELTLSTPALFFSAISLLMLAFTNRFLHLAQLVRSLHANYKEKPSDIILKQIQSLRIRLHLIRSMQIYGISSLLVCVICMFLIYIHAMVVAEILFGIGMVLLIISLSLSIYELQLSVKALNLHLSDIDHEGK